MALATRLAAIVLVVPCAGAQAADACDCPDVPDLLNRIAVAHAAIDKLTFELPVAIKRQAMTTGPAPPPNLAGQSNKDVLASSIIFEQSIVQDVGARSGKGETLVDCKSTTKADTPCLKQVLDVHEAVHHAKCEADKNKFQIGPLEDRWKRKSLAEYITEDIAGYEAEIADALRRLRAMPSSCRPAGWRGVISAFEVMALETSEFTKPTNKYADGTRDESKNNVSRWGGIVYGPTPRARWTAQRVFTKTSVSGSLVACQGGLKTVPANQHETHTMYSKIAGQSAVSDPNPTITVDFTPDRLYYEISFIVPQVKVAVKESGYDRSEGGCQAYNIDVPDYPPVDSPVAALSLLKVKGQMKPTDTSIGGSKVEDLMPVKFSAPGFDSLSHTVRVQWHLYRFD